MLQRKIKFMSTVFVALLIVLTVLSGCSGTKKDQNQAQDNNTGKPTEINIMNIFYSKEPISPNNPVLQEVEKRTNTKLNITWVSPNSYNDKQNVVLASGDIPELMLIRDPFAPNVVTMAEQGAFWDLTPYLKDYPNLMKIPQSIWDTMKIDGKNYGVVDPRPLEGSGFPMLRKDWLDKLHLKMPETIDDFYNVMKAFTEQDPDGNGKKDTVGFVGNVGSEDMGKLNWVENILNGSNGRWKVQGDHLQDTLFEPGTRNSLLWWQKVYNEGLIPADFAVLKQTQVTDMVKAGKAGMSLQTLNNIWDTGKYMVDINPEAVYTQVPYLSGPFGKMYFQGSGYFGMNVIPKSVPEAKMKKILKFLDYGASEEGHTLYLYGFPNVHYTVKDGFNVPTKKAEEDNFLDLFRLGPYYDKYQRAITTGIPKNLYETAKSIIDEQAKYGVADPSIGLQCETCDKVGSEYNKKIQDLKVKIIMNKEPIEAWDQLLNQLKADKQFQKMTEEINASYKKKIAK